jgi:RHS repeat-associated protein
MNDAVMGSWTYQYDDFNRLTNGAAASGFAAGLNLSWTYDRYGNRWAQNATGSGGAGAVQPQLSFTGNNNRVDGWNYDQNNGNLLNDGRNSYTYDAENRIATLNGQPTYVYDAEGRRVAKYSDGAITASYILGLGGEQVTELNVSGAWVHSNAYAGGRMVATYEGPAGPAAAGYHFHLTDWLGTNRMQVSPGGGQDEICTSYPFGDGLNCTGPDATEHHFTGKERDSESGLDYFGVRYLNSNLGRFMTPDWAGKPTAVPYAKYGNPQSLNLYAYVGNNPNTGIDADGHEDDCSKITVTVEKTKEPEVTSSRDGRTSTATVEGEVQYTIKNDGKPVAETQIHEDVSNKNTRDGRPDQSTTIPNDEKTNDQGVIKDQSTISVTTSAPSLLGTNAAEKTLSSSVFSKETTQTLMIGSTGCQVTEKRTLSNASGEFTLTLQSPETQTATPTPTPQQPPKQPQAP